jgi:predicted kinase
MNMDIRQLIELINASPPTLFLLCGLPYSGKTFCARKILGQTACQYVAIDTILARLGYDWEQNKLPDADGWKEVFQISYEEAMRALHDGKSVLYDSTNHTRASRNSVKEAAEKAGASLRIIFLDTPPEVVRERWKRNKITKERFILSEQLLEETIRAMEAPGSDEDVILIS